MKFIVYQDRKKLWRWRLRAKNGKTIADSGEGYSSKRKCLHGISIVTSCEWTPIEEMA